MITDTITEEARDQIRQMQDEIERLRSQLDSVKVALSLGAFEARQLVKNSKGPRDRTVALSFESFCKTHQTALSDDLR